MSVIPRRSSAGAVALGGSVTVVYVLPVVLTGALAVPITRELGFGAVGLGLAVALPRGAAAVMSPYLGSMADRLGATRTIRIAAAMAAISSLGIAMTATRWDVLVIWLLFSGGAQAMGTPAANRLLSNVVRPGRLGTAFGLKQTAPPVATMLAGFSVPLIALTVGWRWAYIIAAVLALAVVIAARRPPPRDLSRNDRTARRKLENPGLIVLLAVAFGLGNTVTSAITTFYVDAAVQSGSTQQLAGTVLGVASIVAVGCRIVAGAASDRLATGHLRLCAIMVAVGSGGVGLLATGRPGWMAIGALIALAGTWGYNGVYWFALVRAYPAAPGRVTGVVAPGVLIGATVGPTVFGLIAEGGGYTLAWAVATMVSVSAAVVMAVCSRYLPDPRATADA